MPAVLGRATNGSHDRIRVGVTLSIRKAPDEIPDNIEFTAQELLEAPVDQRAAMLKSIAKSLTRRLLRDNPGIGIRDVSGRVANFLGYGLRRRSDLEWRG